jgi:hypothetical protein
VRLAHDGDFHAIREPIHGRGDRRRAAVVADDDLEHVPWERLRRETLETARQTRVPAVGGDDDGHRQWSCIHWRVADIVSRVRSGQVQGAEMEEDGA